MPQQQADRYLKFVLHYLYFLSGIATVLIGQVLPVFARHFSLNDLQASYFFPCQFAGSLGGTYLTSRFGKRDNFLAATVIGSGLIGVGLLLMNVDLFSACLIGFFINGLGIGMTLPSINMLILESAPERSASALSVLNFCWGLGAIVSKPFVDLFSSAENIRLTTIYLAAPILVATTLLFFASGKERKSRQADDRAAEPDLVPIWSLPLAWLVALFNFVHVGFESGVGGWLTTYSGRLEGEQLTPWVSPTLLYFLFFVIGRGFAPLLFRFLNENKMLMLGLMIALCGTVLSVSAVSVVALSLGAAIAGFGTSWIFPTNVSRFSKLFGPAAARRSTPLFICGTLGAASSTWLIGFVSNQTGSLNLGMYVLLISVVLLIALQFVLATRGGKQSIQA